MKSNARKAIYASVVGTVVVMSGAAQAAAICGGTAGNGSAISGSTDFIKVTFTPKCSNNVLLDGIDSAAAYFVKSASTKGKTVYGGATNAGTVTVCTTFTTAPSGVTASTGDGCA